MNRSIRYAALLVVLGLLFVANATGAGKSDIKVTHQNHIRQVYLGQTRNDGKTEIVCEFEGHKFLSNQSTYSCIMVNRRIVGIREYNNEDSYVRGFVALGDDEKLIVYSGVLERVGRLNPHDHASLWKAFVDSGRTPFVAKRAALPKWWVSNPIRERRAKRTTTGRKESQAERVRRILADSGHPRLQKKDYPPFIHEALHGNFRATWGLAISGYTAEAAGALMKIVSDVSYKKGVRGYAAMGLGNYLSAMPGRDKMELKGVLGGILANEKNPPAGVGRLLKRLSNTNP